MLHAHKPPVDLTKNQQLVFDALRQAKVPLSAYALLEGLRVEGLKAPLQVYRALQKLVQVGLVHRLESLSAFVACQHPGCNQHSASAFSICDACGGVSELSTDRLSELLKTMAGEDGFSIQTSVVELHGNCTKCAASK